jgi:hypothetical protein
VTFRIAGEPARALFVEFAVTGALRTLGSIAKMVVGRFPLCLPLMRRVFPKGTVSPAKDLVVEGFPRSATGFSVNFLLLSQNRPLEIAQSVHIPAQLIYAVRKGIPGIVLVRDPLDAVTSHLIASPWIPLWLAMLRYILFYRPLRKFRRDLVIADFESVTGDFNLIIRRINEKFGLGLAPVDHEALSSEVFAELDRINEGRGIGNRMLQRPTGEREPTKQQIRPRVEASRLFPAARRLYREFVEGS